METKLPATVLSLIIPLCYVSYVPSGGMKPFAASIFERTKYNRKACHSTINLILTFILTFPDMHAPEVMI